MKKAPIPIPTVDIFNGNVVLVTKGEVTQTLSENPRVFIAEHLAIFPRFLITDLNAVADEKDTRNEALICEMAKKYNCYVAGGIRTLEKAQRLLNHSARRVYIGSCPELIKDLPRSRVCLAIDMDGEKRVLVRNRKVALSQTVEDRIREYNPSRVALTFHELEGSETKDVSESLKYVFTELQKQFPDIEFTVAGGHWDSALINLAVEKLGIAPQIGASWHRGHISTADLFIACLHEISIEPCPRYISVSQHIHDQWTWATVVQDVSGQVLTVGYSTMASLKQAIETRQCVLWSTKRQVIWKKGETSGNVFTLKQIDLNCENTALKFLVQAKDPNKGAFCHCNKDMSCFHARDPAQAGLVDVQTQIMLAAVTDNHDTYCSQLMARPELIREKVWEEANEFLSAVQRNEDKKEIVGEFCDLLFHMIALLTQGGILVSDAIHELNARRYKVTHRAPFRFPRAVSARHPPGQAVIGICKGRSAFRAWSFVRTMVGEADQYLAMEIKPRDAKFHLVHGIVDAVVGFGDIVDNHSVYELCRDESQHITISVCVKSSNISQIEHLNGKLILTEYRVLTEQFLNRHSIKAKVRELYGSTEELVANGVADACVTVVETGQTLQRLGLRQLANIQTYHLGLYVSKMYLNQQINPEWFFGINVLEGVDGSGKTTMIDILKEIGPLYTHHIKDRGRLSRLTDTIPCDLPLQEKTMVMTADKALCTRRKQLVYADKADQDKYGNKYHTPSAISYYHDKYYELACRYGLPMIDTSWLKWQKVELPAVESDDFKFDALELIAEGHSKIVRKFNDQFLVIEYKPTVYSHTAQREGVVPGTDVQRMRTTRVFLEILRRNQIDHSYIYVGTKYVVARFLQKLPEVEVVVKRFFVGSDKHRYHNFLVMRPLLVPSKIIPEEWEYKKPYVRFDLRNPNHDSTTGKPVGDFPLSESLAKKVINVGYAKNTALHTFGVLQEQLATIGIVLKDICFMLTKNGLCHWGEISSDCGRFMSISDKDSLDKDVWRAGGSSDKVLQKWTLLADRLEEYAKNLKPFVL